LANSKDSEHDFVVVGGGPTGVELAAALVKYLNEIAKKHGLERHSVRLYLVEAAPTVLARLNKKSIQLATKRIKKLGIHLMTNKKLESENAEGLVVEGRLLKTKTVIWTAGVANNPFFADPANSAQLTINKRQRVVVDAHLEAAPDVFVIGDNAATEFAGLAETAVNDAKYLAKYLARSVKGKLTKGYLQPRPITSIPVGDHWALVEWGNLTFGGWPGAAMRKIADLIGYMDILPPKKALKIWLSSGEREDECSVCHKKSVN
jgi:NADH dehydrogenase